MKEFISDGTKSAEEIRHALFSGKMIVTSRSKTWRSPSGGIISVMTHDRNGKELVVSINTEEDNCKSQ